MVTACSHLHLAGILLDAGGHSEEAQSGQAWTGGNHPSGEENRLGLVDLLALFAAISRFSWGFFWTLVTTQEKTTLGLIDLFALCLRSQPAAISVLRGFSCAPATTQRKSNPDQPGQGEINPPEKKTAPSLVGLSALFAAISVSLRGFSWAPATTQRKSNPDKAVQGSRSEASAVCNLSTNHHGQALPPADLDRAGLSPGGL